MDKFLLVILAVLAFSINVFGETQSSASISNSEMSAASVKPTVTDTTQPRIAHSEFFFQAQNQENVFIPQTFFSASHTGEIYGGSTTDSKTTGFGMEYQRGLTSHLAVALDVNYNNTQSASYVNTSTATKSDGLQDLLLSFKSFSGEGATRIYYGLAFDLSLQNSEIGSQDGVNFTKNNYSGGQSVIPSLGVAWILSPKTTIGVYSSYQVRDARTVAYNNLGALNTFTATGGNILKGGFVYEHANENWKLGAAVGVESHEAETGSVSSNYLSMSVPAAQSMAVATVYSAIPAGTLLDFLPKVAYQTNLDGTNGPSSEMQITLAARTAF